LKSECRWLNRRHPCLNKNGVGKGGGVGHLRERQIEKMLNCLNWAGYGTLAFEDWKRGGDVNS